MGKKRLLVKKNVQKGFNLKKKKVGSPYPFKKGNNNPLSKA